ncbi:MAG: hypothetical protein KAS72_00480 [Phycisphaerales bacterium]|nr:hypothetical protein [Phycisphaerales bacterium]
MSLGVLIQLLLSLVLGIEPPTEPSVRNTPGTAVTQSVQAPVDAPADPSLSEADGGGRLALHLVRIAHDVDGAWWSTPPVDGSI